MKISAQKKLEQLSLMVPECIFDVGENDVVIWVGSEGDLVKKATVSQSRITLHEQDMRAEAIARMVHRDVFGESDVTIEE